MLNPRHLVIRHISPWIWRRFPARKVEALQRFSQIERDSGCQLLYCQSHVDSPGLRAALFQHLLEEFYHRDIFDKLAQSQAHGHLYESFSIAQELLPEKAGAADVRDFFAYVHLGEQAVNADFLEYAKSRLDSETRAVFRRAGMDEGHHEDSTGDILLDLCQGDRKLYARTLWKARCKRWWSLYRQSMNAFGRIPLHAILAAIYFISGPWLRPVLSRRLQLDRETQLELLRAQVAEFEAGAR